MSLTVEHLKTYQNTMVNQQFTQICQECGETTYGQVAPAVQTGDTVKLYCGECDEETDHALWD